MLVLGILEAAFIALRRWFVLTPGTHVEAAMRNTLYAKLQDLPVAFHDRWQSGQLLSRSMSDLGLIRRWLAFGIVLLVVNGVTIVVGVRGAVLLELACSACSSWSARSRSGSTGYVFEQKYSVVARRLSQDQQGDLATAVEESVHGIRVLKAFGRGKHSLEKLHAPSRATCGAPRLEKATRHRRHLALAAPGSGCRLRRSALLGGVWLASTGQMTRRRSSFAFFATATVLRVPDRVDRHSCSR